MTMPTKIAISQSRFACLNGEYPFCHARAQKSAICSACGAIYETSPLQRRLRDLHTAAQHFAAQQRHYVSAGKLLLSGSAGS
jgi:hypothetical protein